MKFPYKVKESSVFISVVKWFILATIVGVIVGLSTTLFLNILSFSILKVGSFSYFYLLLPIVLVISVFVTKIAPDSEGHGTEKVIAAIHKKSGKINVLVVPIKLFTTILTLAFGGSVGKEGPCAQIGAGLSSAFSDIFRFDDHDRKKLVICGISAGFASVFGTPIAGAIFGVEVLFVGTILYDVLLPSFIAGITAYQISSTFGVKYFYNQINILPAFNEIYFLKVVLAGIFFGICAIYLIDMMKVGEFLSKRIKINAYLKAFGGGVLLILLTFVFSQKFLGLGLETMESCLQGNKIIWYTFLVKVVFTVVTLASGGSGGILTPIFFIGATAGSVFAQIFNLDLAVFSSIGMVCLLAACANTPIAASILSVEIFGPKLAPYATVACIISFLMTGHKSIYPSQVLAMNKTMEEEVEIGKELDAIQDNYNGPNKNYILKALKYINNRIKQIK